MEQARVEREARVEVIDNVEEVEACLPDLIKRMEKDSRYNPMPDYFTADQVYPLVLAGHLRVWKLICDKEIIGYGVTDIAITYSTAHLHIAWAGGDMNKCPELVDMFIEAVADWGKEIGFKKLVSSSRPGIGKKLKGFKELTRNYERTL